MKRDLTKPYVSRNSDFRDRSPAEVPWLRSPVAFRRRRDTSWFELAVLVVIWGAMLAFVAFAVCSLPGCQSAAAIGNRGIAASAGLSEDLNTAHSEISTAAPHADKIGQAHLASADAAISAGKSKLPAIDAGLAQVGPLSAKVTKLEKQFFSPRQVGLFRIVLIVGGLIVTVLCVLYFATPFGAPIGVFAGLAFHVLTGGLTKLAGGIANKIETNVLRAKAGTKAAPIAVTPPATEP